MVWIKLQLKKEFISELRVREGIKIYSLELFRSGKTIDEEKDYDFFIETQKNIFEETDIKIDEKTESRSLDRFRITVYTMEHGKRLGREQVDVQKRGQKAAGR